MVRNLAASARPCTACCSLSSSTKFCGKGTALSHRHLKESGFDPEQAAFQEVSLASEETHNSSVVVGRCNRLVYVHTFVQVYCLVGICDPFANTALVVSAAVTAGKGPERLHGAGFGLAKHPSCCERHALAGCSGMQAMQWTKLRQTLCC